MLRVKNLSLGYGRSTIIKDLSVEFPRGKISTIIGPNGCGKSTFLKAINKTLKPLSGHINYMGRNIYDYPKKQLAREIAFLPQAPKVPFEIKVKDLISMGRYPYLNIMNRYTSNDKEIINDIIKKLSLQEYIDKSMSELSGGEKQRVWLAMTLVQEPNLLLLDEPTTYLDLNFQYEILGHIKKLNRDYGLTIVMVLHDINQASCFSDCIYVLDKGALIKSGSPKEVITKRVLKNVFNLDVEFCNNSSKNPIIMPIT